MCPTILRPVGVNRFKWMCSIWGALLIVNCFLAATSFLHLAKANGHVNKTCQELSSGREAAHFSHLYLFCP